ncbi:MAG: hypothetical protein FWH43_02330 [Endomicrobia bacterium]|nr:hypothetical protein [Endomicrobiia bacterium]
MKIKFLQVIVSYVIMLFFSCSVFANLIERPYERIHVSEKDIIKKVKPQKGSLKEYQPQQKTVKAVIVDKKDVSLFFEPHGATVKIGDFVKKGQLVGVNSIGKHHYAEISGYIHWSHALYEINPEFIFCFTAEYSDLMYLNETNPVDIILKENPLEKTQGCILFEGRINLFYAIASLRTLGFKKFKYYATPLNQLSEKEQKLIKIRESIDVVLTFSPENICLVPNEFIHEHAGKKFVIFRRDDDYIIQRCQVITGISDGKYTEILFPNLSADDDLLALEESKSVKIILLNVQALLSE